MVFDPDEWERDHEDRCLMCGNMEDSCGCDQPGSDELEDASCMACGSSFCICNNCSDYEKPDGDSKNVIKYEELFNEPDVSRPVACIVCANYLCSGINCTRS